MKIIGARRPFRRWMQAALVLATALALWGAHPGYAAAQAPNGITTPAVGAQVRGLLTIGGAANHAQFRKWQVDLLVNGDPNQAHFLGLSEEPAPEPAPLVTIDTTAFPDGDHLLRLRVVHSNLNYDEYETPITIANAAPAAPAEPAPAAAPEAPPPAPLFRTDAPPDGRKWIEVDLSDQTLTAWQGDVAVFHTSVSTGKPGWRTLPGTFAVYLKYEKARMVGEDYDTPDVPWTMYYSGDFGIHGAYWHNNFGTPVSHGCVNMRVDEAKALYEWAPMGTTVVVNP